MFNDKKTKEPKVIIKFKVQSSMINKRKDFPILSREVYGKPLVYLDNAATTQKPLCVLDAMRDEYLNVNANVHRGVHYLSQQATDLHEAGARRCASLSMRVRPRRLSLHAAPPRPSTSWPARSASRRCSQAMRCWSLIWSTTPISCHGSCRP